MGSSQRTAAERTSLAMRVGRLETGRGYSRLQQIVIDLTATRFSLFATRDLTAPPPIAGSYRIRTGSAFQLRRRFRHPCPCLFGVFPPPQPLPVEMTPMKPVRNVRGNTFGALAVAGLMTVALGGMSAAANAGSCPAGQVTIDGQKPGATAHMHVTDKVIASIDLVGRGQLPILQASAGTQ
jgi:hypothetical protein